MQINGRNIDHLLEEIRQETRKKLTPAIKRKIKQFLKRRVSAPHAYEYSRYYSLIEQYISSENYDQAVACMYYSLIDWIIFMREHLGEHQWEHLVPDNQKLADFNRTSKKLFAYINQSILDSSDNDKPTNFKEFENQVGRETYDIPDPLTTADIKTIKNFMAIVPKIERWYRFNVYQSLGSNSFFLAPIKGQHGHIKDYWNTDGLPHIADLFSVVEFNNNRIAYYAAKAANICGVTHTQNKTPISQGGINSWLRSHYKKKKP